MTESGLPPAHVETSLVLERAALLRYVRRRWPTLDADDIVQEVCLAFWTRPRAFDSARPVMNYLYGITRHRVMDRLRDHYRRHAREVAFDDTSSDAVSEATTGIEVDVDRLLAALPAGQRAAIVATKLNGLSVVEAAQTCGQSVSLIKVNCHRGMRRMAREVRSFHLQSISYAAG